MNLGTWHPALTTVDKYSWRIWSWLARDAVPRFGNKEVKTPIFSTDRHDWD